ncbi:MAG: hypothetical protein AABX59_01825 [Nanoarchaeota archaeon]
MSLSDLRAGQSRVDLEADVVEVSETRSFVRFGRVIRVANAVIKDEEGEGTLTLWNNDVDKVKSGDHIKITNGFVKEFNGKLTLTAGKFGKIEVMDENTSARVSEEEVADEMDEVAEEEVAEEVEESEDEMDEEATEEVKPKGKRKKA